MTKNRQKNLKEIAILTKDAALLETLQQIEILEKALRRSLAIGKRYLAGDLFEYYKQDISDIETILE